MKDELLGQIKNVGGLSTVELLIALAITTVLFSAVFLVSFGNQSLLTDNALATGATTKIKDILENEQTLARKDFRLVNPVPETVDGIYKKTVSVETQPDFFTKKVTAKVGWNAGYARDLQMELSVLVTNYENAIGGNTCDSVLAGDWTNPQFSSYDFGGTLLTPPDTSGQYPITDIDISHNKMYVSINNQNANTNKTFFTFDVSDHETTPVHLGGVDNALTVSAGLNAVHVTGNYAYAANGYGANFDTCTTGTNCAQLQIISTLDPVSPTVVKSFKVPGVTGSGGQAVGKSIFYKGGFIYLGLSKTGSGPEFNIIDVKDPADPKWIGGFSVGNGINAIYVRGRYAYLATPNDEELMILDLAIPENPFRVGGFDAPGGSGNGKNIDLVGNTLYLGRTVGGEELYVLDDSNPASSLPILGSQDLGSESANGLIVRDTLAFLLLNTQFQIWNIKNPSVITSYASPFSLSAISADNTGNALECEGNYIYFGSTDNVTNKGYITGVKAGL